MAHNHTHHHDHAHHHHSGSKNIAVAFFLNLGFAIFEFLGGLYTNSLAITSDALHDFGDSISLGVSWYFEKVSKRAPTQRFSYGMKRLSLIGALVNSLVLLVGAVVILYETIPRLIDPQPSNAEGMFVFAVIGIAVNGYAMLRLRRGESINERVVSLHLLEDVLGWVAVLVGSVLMYFFDIPILDPVLSLGITVYILFNVFGNIRSVMRIILQGVPEELDLSDINAAITQVKGVASVHDLHVWSMDSRYNVLSAHIVSDDRDIAEIKKEIRELLAHRFNIEHATIEVESVGEECSMVDCN